MRYPNTLLKHISEVEEIVSKWPVDKDLRNVLNWLMQFNNEDIELGIRVIKNLNVIGFEDLNTALTIAYSKLERMAIDKGTKINNKNTLFAGIGDSAKSGAMIGYNFRIINELSEDNFINDDSLKYLEEGLIDNIVLIDDIVGTGKQATDEIKSLTEKVIPLGVKNIFLLTAVGMKEGIKKISDDTKAYVFSAFEYTELDTVTCLDAPFYDGIPHEARLETKRRLEYYGKITNSATLGYGGIGALIAFYYNTPNISLPIIWGSKNSWIPLFKRAVKINGINAYYKHLDLSMNKKKKNHEPLKAKENTFLLFVEGKTDEMFFDYIISKIKDSLHYDKVNVISLGGFFSKSLISNITKLNENYLFIIDDDLSGAKIIENLEDKPYLFTKTYYDFLNLGSLIENENWAFLSVNNKKIDLSNKEDIKKLQREIFIRFARNEVKFHEFLENYLDKENFGNFVNILIEKINNINN